jgi:ribosomal protein S6E (S10)
MQEVSRQVRKRLMFKQAFGYISEKFGGEKRKTRRAMAWSLAKRTIRGESK